MAGFLFQRIVFGPVQSRRLGHSLGINLLPHGCKVCTYNCTYCECGFTKPLPDGKDYPSLKDVMRALEGELFSMREAGLAPDSITFAGNGEPTMHPDFLKVMKGTVKLRNLYFPEARIAVLSNSTIITQKSIAEALALADLSMLKLDAGTEDGFQRLNRPVIQTSLEEITQSLVNFKGRYVIQSMFTEGSLEGQPFDNTQGAELEEWMKRLKRLSPDYVMIYSLDRASPTQGLKRVGRDTLKAIATRVEEETGFLVEVY